MKALLISFATLVCLAVSCHAQCSGGTTDTWVDQPYQTDPSSLDDPNGTPVGFDSLDFPGIDEQNGREPCVQVTFPSGSLAIRYLYVLVASPIGRVCVGIEGETETSCGDADFSYCISNVDGNPRLEFSCDASCAQNEFTFQYRVVLESRAADDEFFCNNINATFPSSLQVLPTNAVTLDPNPSQSPNNGATILSPLVLGSLLLVTLLAMLFMH
ncbi:uncharacterized protein LOC135346826 [Halichondria panicea]|uniref:uncharacterized protein LOC135346826 n=1 Tax=Halichondria panicea TaxID=6063 RepID=UPI00312B33C0